MALIPAPAPVSTRSSCPAAASSRTESGVNPTRYSCSLISFGTPIRIRQAPDQNAAYAQSPWMWYDSSWKTIRRQRAPRSGWAKTGGRKPTGQRGLVTLPSSMTKKFQRLLGQGGDVEFASGRTKAGRCQTRSGAKTPHEKQSDRGEPYSGAGGGGTGGERSCRGFDRTRRAGRHAPRSVRAGRVDSAH